MKKLLVLFALIYVSTQSDCGKYLDLFLDQKTHKLKDGYEGKVVTSCTVHIVYGSKYIMNLRGSSRSNCKATIMHNFDESITMVEDESDCFEKVANIILDNGEGDDCRSVITNFLELNTHQLKPEFTSYNVLHCEA